MATSTDVPFYVGNTLRIDHKIGGLKDPLVSAKLCLKHAERDTTPYATFDITATPSSSGQILDPGTAQIGAEYEAEVLFLLSGGPTGDTVTHLKPGVPAYACVECVTQAGEFYNAKLKPITPGIGGRYG